MPNSNRLLALNAREADVVYLHVSLSKLGYTIPKGKLDEEVFGDGTRDVLLTLQAKYHLPRTDGHGEVMSRISDTKAVRCLLELDR